MFIQGFTQDGQVGFKGTVSWPLPQDIDVLIQADELPGVEHPGDFTAHFDQEAANLGWFLLVAILVAFQVVAQVFVVNGLLFGLHGGCDHSAPSCV